MKFSQLGLVFLGIFLAIGLAVSGYFVGQMMYNAKIAINTAKAKGLAERRVEADVANWKIEYKVTGKSKSEIPQLYKQAEKIQKTIVKLLKDNGFDDQEIKRGVIDYRYREFRDKNQVVVDQEHKLIGSISIETHKVRKVEKVRANVNKLIAQGIDILKRRLEGKQVTYPDGRDYDWQ